MNYPAKYLKIIKEIVLSEINADEHLVFLFGSRVHKNDDKAADVDVGIVGDKPIGNIYYRIKRKIDDSIVPYKVDVVDFSLTDENFKKIAVKEIEIWNRPQVST